MMVNQKAKLQMITRKAEGMYIRTEYRIQWQYEDGTIREPEPVERKFYYPDSFQAAGKRYSSLQELCHVKKDTYGHICQDIYGREVFAEWERYPCFDVYDRMNEDRYYRWFYIREGDHLTCVYRDDGKNIIQITEDVVIIKDFVWKAMCNVEWTGE